MIPTATPTFIIDKYTFFRTCESCPEQYDVYYGANQVGYVRLRYGNLTVDYPDCRGKEILYHHFPDGWKGEFDDSERDWWMSRIVFVIDRYRKGKGK